jgi:hypothetical protein
MSSNNTQSNINASTKLVTVHGTGAGDIDSKGEKWWQLDSTLMCELQSRLDLDPSRIEIVPFQWGEGPNSEEHRRTAGSKLAQLLYTYDESGQDYYIAGHSHGGSVIYNALLKSVANKKHFEGLKIWCTVGTPFLDYRANTFLFQRLKSLGLSVCTTGVVSLILGIWILLMTIFSDNVGPKIEAMGYAMITYGLITYSLLWLYERLRKTWFTNAQKKEVEKQYSKNWCGLWHQEDEAISALSNIKSISAPIIPASFLQPLVTSLQLVTVIFAGAYLAYDLTANKGIAIRNVANTFFDVSATDSADAIYYTIMMFITIFGFMVITFGLTKIASYIALQIGKPLALLLNKITWSSIRQRAWGDDLLKEDVRNVSSHPPDFPHKFDYLDENVASPLRQHSEKNAITTLHKVRLVLGMAPGSSHSVDVRSELGESLNWQELIHTSYFEVPEFIDLLAQSLHNAGLGEFKQEK